VNLETERLLLRPMVMDDLDVYADFYADSEVTRYLGSGQTMTRRQTEAQLRDLIQREERYGFGLRSVVRKEDGRLLGRSGLHRWEIDGVEEMEVGWVFGKEFWGHGYATEAALVVRDHALAELGHTRLIALIKHENERSQNVAKKLGLTYERDVELPSGPAQLYALEVGPAR
jgi:[ribosomal protein S5]-alanine N-acetyltransferase